MKHLFKSALAGLSAVSIMGAASADTILPVQVSETAKGTYVCVGDRDDPARYGGVEVDAKGQASIVIPSRSYRGDLIASVIITAAGPEAGVQREINYNEWQNPKMQDGLRLDLGGSRVSCGQAFTAEALAGEWAKAAERLSEPVMAELKRQYSTVSPRIYSAYIAENAKAMASYTDLGIIPNGGTRAAIASVIKDAVARQDAKERQEELEQFIEDLAAAAEAYAEERDRKLAEARAKARAEAEARAAAEAAARAEEQRREISEGCFGAIGPGCGIWEGKFPPSLCGPSDIKFTGENAGLNWGCAINSGSWKHDECCVRDPKGHWCFGAGTPTASCTVAFDRGLRHLVSPYTWERHDIDINKRNTTGIVIHQDYCAKNGTLMLKDETGYCCSKNGGKLSWWGVAAFISNHGAWAFNAGNSRYCKA